MNNPNKPAYIGTVSLPQQSLLTIEQAMAKAAQLQSEGRLQEAEHLLQQVLQQMPQHPFALHLLGVIAHQCGKQPLAEELIKRAIAADNGVALFHANLCEISRQLKLLDQAVAHGERAVALEPRLVMAHSNLGVAYFDLKEYDKAEASQQRALALDPNFAPSLNNLGSIWRERKSNEAALEWYRKAAASNPSYLEPLNNLGALLLEEDRIPEALEALEKALRLHPDYAEAICNMGGIQLAQEENDIALNSFKRALELRPVYIEAQMGLSKALQALEQFEEAETAAIHAIQLDNLNPKAHALLGSICSEMALPERAENAFNRALEIDPDNDEALLGLGQLCIENGEQVRAEELFQRALALKPDNVLARVHLIQARKVTPDDENFSALAAMQKDADNYSDNRKLSLHFALGKCYDDTEDYDRAFPHFLEGCKLKRAKLNYDPVATAQLFTELKEIFIKENIDRLRGAGDPSDLPIFVLGMPRSGTTLTEQILASHPDVFGAGELPDLLRVAHRKTDPKTTSFPDNLRYLNQATLSAWGAEYITGLKQLAPGSKHITDKMPENFLAVPLIHLMLPNAKIIHINRNPVDTCLSCFTHLFNRKQEHTYDLAELGRYYADYVQLMDHWRRVLPAGAFLDINYEDIVADQEGQARRLLEYCGLEWDPACIDFHKTKRQIRTASLTQVRQPIYKTSVERWRKYEKFLGPLLDELGNLVPGQKYVQPVLTFDPQPVTLKSMTLNPSSMTEGICWPVIPFPRSAELLAMQYQLDQTQWLSTSKLEEHQFSQAKVLLGHALHTVPYYREKYGALTLPARLDWDTWRSLPILERSEIQEHTELLKSAYIPPSHGNIRMTGSSGSTGRPLKVLGTDTTHLFWLSLTLRDHVWQKRDLARKLAAIRTKVKSGSAPGWAEWSDSIITGPSAVLNIEASVDEQLDWLIAEDPGYLLTHPTNLHALVTRAAERGLRPANLCEVRTFGEMLQPDLRELIRQVWGVKLTDMYSAEEVGYIALQCPVSENYHIQSENLLVEILNEHGKPCLPGEIGEVVVTSLHNFAMPLIRYRILDHVEVAPPCACGRGLTAIRRILGRQRNMIAMPDGTFHWPAFPDWLSVAPVRQFQMIQHDTRVIEVKLVCPRALSPQEEDGIRAMLADKFGYPFDFRFNYRDSIETGPNGKFEDFVSLVRPKS